MKFSKLNAAATLVIMFCLRTVPTFSADAITPSFDPETAERIRALWENMWRENEKQQKEKKKKSGHKGKKDLGEEPDTPWKFRLFTSAWSGTDDRQQQLSVNSFGFGLNRKLHSATMFGLVPPRLCSESVHLNWRTGVFAIGDPAAQPFDERRFHSIRIGLSHFRFYPKFPVVATRAKVMMFDLSAGLQSDLEEFSGDEITVSFLALVVMDITDNFKFSYGLVASYGPAMGKNPFFIFPILGFSYSFGVRNWSFGIFYEDALLAAKYHRAGSHFSHLFVLKFEDVSYIYHTPESLMGTYPARMKLKCGTGYLGYRMKWLGTWNGRRLSFTAGLGSGKIGPLIVNRLHAADDEDSIFKSRTAAGIILELSGTYFF